MSAPTIGEFISHCDDCDLGKFEYQCPACRKFTSNYDELWWEQERMYDGTIFFYCHKDECAVKLKAYWSKEELEYLVELA